MSMSNPAIASSVPIFQIALLLCLASFIVGAVLLRLRGTFSTVLTVLLTTVFLVGSVFVVRPEITSEIARLIGVRRGADLLLYASIIGGIAVSMVLYARLRRMREEMTILVRALALNSAEKSDSATEMIDDGDRDSHGDVHA